MNVATKLLLERMERDIDELKQQVSSARHEVSVLANAINEINGTVIKPDSRPTLTLPSKRKNAQAN